MCLDLKPDVGCITESWTKDEHTKAFLRIDGFRLVCREDRRDTTAGCGGGLLIWVREDIAAPESKRPEYTAFNQCCAVKLPIKGGKTIELVLVYRPHKLYHGDANIAASVKDNNAKLATLFKCVQKPSVMLGDFNCSDVDWEVSHSGSNGRFLLEAAEGNFFTQHVDFSTLAAADTCPDLVFSSCSSLVLSVDNAGKLGSSDHTMLLVEIAGKLPTQTTTTELVPDWAKANLPGLKEDLAAVNWESELEDLECESAWTMFKSKVDELQAKHVPMKKRRTNRRPLWMNTKIMRTIRKKRKLWKRYSQSRDYEDHQAYKKVEREVQRSVRKAKRDFERQLA